VEILALGVLLSGFLLGLVLGAPYVGLLRRFRIGQNIRPEGPQTHYVKQGIPTMGGGLFIGVTFVLWLFVLLLISPEQRDLFIPPTIVPIGTLIFVGVLAAIYIQRHFGVTGLYVPLVGELEIGGALFVALALFAIVAMSNGVNLTDGMDGLAGGTAVFAFLSIAFIAAARGFEWLVVLCAAMVGALLAFLWFNVHPAEVIMGDTGALALGAMLATIGLTTGFALLLPVLGVIFVAETLSVMIQVGSFKLRGKRIFRMSPLHNHFELIGWAEEKVTIRFWLIGAVAGIAAAVLAYATPR
jgi:phospho-N-acetylmuramoyl-pentapeptide-transferase